jgi:hypothetical protein
MRKKRQTIEEMEAAIAAFKRDGRIQYNHHHDEDGWEETTNPTWDFASYSYHAVPPKPRTVWVTFHSDHTTLHVYADENTALNRVGSMGYVLEMQEVVAETQKPAPQTNSRPWRVQFNPVPTTAAIMDGEGGYIASNLWLNDALQIVARHNQSHGHKE